MMMFYQLTFMWFCAIRLPLAYGQYILKDTYQGNNFFGQFNFDTVHYGQFGKLQTYDEAVKLGMVNSTDSTVYIGTDYTNVVNSSGRPVIEISSKNQYDNGLFILDATHMPQGCGTWPAWWLMGPNWPENGEIDIVENIDLLTYDQSTLHATNGCDFSSVKDKMNMTGYVASTNCSYQPGCAVILNNQQNVFGVNFNNNGGGIYVCEVNDDSDNGGIRMWFFTHENAPKDITSDNPNPDHWEIPYADWPFGDWCPSTHFNELKILFDLYYCGWAGTSSDWTSECDTIADNASCEDFVMNNPNYFRDAYWEINYVKVFQK